MGCITSKENDIIDKQQGETSPEGSGGKKYPIYGPSSIMSKKKCGSSATPVQKNLRWNCDYKTANRICNHNRHFAEHSGYFQKRQKFLEEVNLCKRAKKRMTFYDSNTTGETLFYAPKNRTWHEFIQESKAHGWPSFRDSEVNWDQVRCLKGGEVVSLAGTHLGHNLPDKKGNRYCINLVSVAGQVPIEEKKKADESNDREGD